MNKTTISLTTLLLLTGCSHRPHLGSNVSRAQNVYMNQGAFVPSLDTSRCTQVTPRAHLTHQPRGTSIGTMSTQNGFKWVSIAAARVGATHIMVKETDVYQNGWDASCGFGRCSVRKNVHVIVEYEMYRDVPGVDGCTL